MSADVRFAKTSVSKWIVELKGHPFDLENLPDLLHGSDLSVEKKGRWLRWVDWWLIIILAVGVKLSAILMVQ
jgi:hypothetical protein